MSAIVLSYDIEEFGGTVATSPLTADVARPSVAAMVTTVQVSAEVEIDAPSAAVTRTAAVGSTSRPDVEG